MKKTAVERYTGESKPPCFVMTLSLAVPDEITLPDLSLPVTLTGVKLSQPLKLERKAGMYSESFHHGTGNL